MYSINTNVQVNKVRIFISPQESKKKDPDINHDHLLKFHSNVFFKTTKELIEQGILSKSKNI